MFDFVTGEATPQSIEFKTVAREISGLDSLNAFLEAYRNSYASNDGLAPLRPTAGGEA